MYCYSAAAVCNVVVAGACLFGDFGALEHLVLPALLRAKCKAIPASIVVPHGQVDLFVASAAYRQVYLQEIP